MISILKGAYETKTRQDLHDIPVTPRGRRSSRWLGLQHGEFIERVIELLRTEFNIVPHNEVYAVSPNDAVLIGGFELATPSKNPNQPTLMSIPGAPSLSAYSFGMRHSNDSRFAVTCVSGGRVMICENGIANGEEKWKHKHTSGFNLKDFILNGLKRFLSKLQDIAKAVTQMASIQIDQPTFDGLLLALGRSNILPWRLLGEVDKNWLNDGTNPNFSGSTLWDWYNTVNQQIKQLPVIHQYTSLQKAFQLGFNLTE